MRSAEESKIQGNEHYKKKNFTEALSCYNKAIELDGSEILYYNNKAACLIEMKNLEEAMKTVDEAIEKISELHISDFVKIAKVLARKGNIHAHM